MYYKYLKWYSRGVGSPPFVTEVGLLLF